MVTPGTGARGITLYVRRTRHDVTLYNVTHISVSEDQTKKRFSPKVSVGFRSKSKGRPQKHTQKKGLR